MPRLTALPILLVLFATSVSAQEEPVTETPTTSAPFVCHWEIMSNDAPALRTFYQSLFGWEPMVWETNPDYALIPSTGEGYGIAGGIGQIQENEFPSYLTFYIEVADLDASVAAIPTLGGTVVVPPMEIPDVGRMALFTDPAGSMTGLIESTDWVEPAPLAPSPHPVVHFEIGAHDPAPVRDFYASLLGWTYTVYEGFGYAEVVLPEDGPGIGGGIATIPAEAPNYVAVYVSVPDLQATLDAAAALGATVVLPPMPVDETLSLAMFVDPQGFPMGLVHMAE